MSKMNSVNQARSPALQRSLKSKILSKSSQKTVKFENLRSLLLKKDWKVYEELVCYIRDTGAAIKDEDLIQLLHEARDCISILNENLKLFVQVLLILKWTQRSEAVVKEYQAFLLELCLAHSYYIKFALDQLVATFIRVDKDSSWSSGYPTAEEEKEFQNVHKVLQTFVKVVPMSPKILLKCIRKQYPYHLVNTAIYVCYFYNILHISKYALQIRPDILFLLVQKLVVLDSLALRNEIISSEKSDQDLDEGQIFSMELSSCDKKFNSDQKMKLDAADKLDACLNRFYEYIHSTCYSKGNELHWETTKTLYQELFNIFEQVILPTYDTCHVQFILFYLLSFKEPLVEYFLNSLWKEISSPGIPPVFKQAAISYIASMLARASFIKMRVIPAPEVQIVLSPFSDKEVHFAYGLLRAMLSELANWIHSYILNMDGFERNRIYLKRHSVFYSVCQALFYVIAFRHADLVSNKKNLAFLQSLNLAKIVTCQLNPLCVCAPAVASNFACVTRAYQLAYCYSVMEHNSRYLIPSLSKEENPGDGVVLSTSNQIHLDSFFPFDPYLLKRSKQKIDPLYKEYISGLLNQEMPVTEAVTPKQDDDEEDDFLMDVDSQTPQSSNYAKFNYSTSPGFKYQY